MTPLFWVGYARSSFSENAELGRIVDKKAVLQDPLKKEYELDRLEYFGFNWNKDSIYRR